MVTSPGRIFKRLPIKRFKPLLLIVLLVFVGYSFSATAAVEGYTIGPGDELEVNVFGEPDLSVSRVRVDWDGKIPYPLLGRIEVSGHTVLTLEKHIAAKLRQGYLYRPQVTITVVNYRPYYLKGKVNRPGTHKYIEGLTVDQALIEAGGVESGQRLLEISLMRGAAEPIVVDGSHPVLPGDVLTVKTEEIKVVQESVDYIYLYGEVKKAGSFRFREGLTVEKAVALAGGFGRRASKRKINISREIKGEGTQTLEKVELSEPVLPGDVITVGESWF